MVQGKFYANILMVGPCTSSGFFLKLWWSEKARLIGGTGRATAIAIILLHSLPSTAYLTFRPKIRWMGPVFLLLLTSFLMFFSLLHKPYINLDIQSSWNKSTDEHTCFCLFAIISCILACRRIHPGCEIF